MKAHAVSIFAGLLFLVSGCSTTVYEYTPPVSDQGKLCVAQCSVAQESCRGDARTQAAQNHARCEAQSNRDYSNCLIVANTTEQKKACQRKKRYCGEFANTDRCEERYRSCFTTCGGQITSREE